ncbi:Rpn family recombination-promoting nuclease/putative transposase [Clostridium tarantellae]|uniref:Rpn family recombination-promoting nuclease/putative transposase n=1 Tax=Clostridium tarantellae TaxID=39493 RepID=A0A6I1MMZ9_9CLOT|nr:Rpn family recombination-promoting nuclease/putative transposase [Clostridium tarantellae]MPQ43622.1 Rpn family recombination-promoting nuclease/putative transposase [Clostridium tarantellae]
MALRTLMKPTMDFVFKKIFGSENNKDSLISFLNSVIKPKDPIRDVKIENNDIDKEYLSDKFSRLDIKATTDKGELINIEVQVSNEYNMIQRTLYYWSKIYSDQLQSTENYSKLARTVCINILNFKYLDNDRFHNVYRMKEVITNEELTDIEEIHFLELPKSKDLGIIDSEKEVENIDSLLKWVEFLKEPESQAVRIIELTDESIRKAKSELYKLSMDKEEIARYRMREKAMYDEISALENSERKGKIEGKLEVAKNLLDILDNETISLKTGLPIEDIEKLRS